MSFARRGEGTITVACRRAGDSDPLPASLPGSYVYAAKGTTLESRGEFAAQLDLRNDKTYTFILDKTVEGKKDPTEAAWALMSYRATMSS